MIIVREYLTRAGRNAFKDWLDSLDAADHGRIRARLVRFELGNFGDHKRVAKGVWEARLMFGPGYRIYFGLDGEEIVLLFGGGTKRTQASDIARAATCWAEYAGEGNRAETKH